MYVFCIQPKRQFSISLGQQGGKCFKKILNCGQQRNFVVVQNYLYFFWDKGANWDIRSQSTVVPLTAMLTPQVESMPALTNISLSSHAHQPTGKGERERAIDRKRKPQSNNSFPFFLYRGPTS